jgi:hypothetical protein
MSRLFGRQRPREIEERLRIAAAVAAEQILDEHATSALEVVAEGADRAPVERLLEAYGRLHYLSDPQQRQLRERVFAALGRDPDHSEQHHVLMAPRSPFQRLARRLRGRVHHELRDWMGSHTARVQLSLIDLHVRHSLKFVAILDGHVSTTEALDMYAHMLHLRETIAEVVRLKALRTLHDAAVPGRVEPLHVRHGPQPLRVADSGG